MVRVFISDVYLFGGLIVLRVLLGIAPAPSGVEKTSGWYIPARLA